MDEKKIQQLETLANLMDSQFGIPGTKFRFGLDSLLGFLPGIGDTIGLVVSGYIYAHAHEYKLPVHVRVRMVWNIFLDWLIGLIPFIGDLFDIGWKANRRNIELLRRHMARIEAAPKFPSSP